MTDINDQFINIFENLKLEINKRADAPNSFDLKLDRAAGMDRFVNNNSARLRYIRDVRNLLQHPQKKTPGRPFEISDGLLREAQALLTGLTNPPVAKDIWVPKSSLTLASRTDRIGKLAAIMKSKGYSHLPILDSSGVVVGVFNEAAVFAHLFQEDVTLIGRDTTVDEIMESCDLSARHTETFEFVRPTTTQDQLVDLFVTLVSSGTRVGAVFVTASGNRKEPLQGLITPWDVLSRLPSRVAL